MASTYSTSLKIQLIGNGEQSGIWGSTTDANWNLMEQAVAGVQTITMSNADYALSNLNGVSDEARNMVLVIQGTNSAIYKIVAPLVPKFYVVSNQTVGGYSITIGGSSGSYVTIPNGYTSQVYCDGINFYAAQTSSAGNWNVSGNLTVGGTTTLTGNVTCSANATVNGNASVLGNLSVTGSITGAWAYMPTGTTVLFYQAAAPTGWTQVTSLNDYAVRIVSGTGGTTGGSVAFSSAFASQAVTGSISIAAISTNTGSYTLTTTDIPGHTHTFSGTASGSTASATANIQNPAHSHGGGFSTTSYVYTVGSSGALGGNRTSTDAATTSVYDAGHSHTFSASVSGTTGSTGSGGGHTHTISLNPTGTFTGTSINLAVQYANVIICSKN